MEQLAEITLINESATEQDEFQTKCLECWMNNYMIDSNGKLLVSTGKKNKPYKKYKHTGSIEMYNYLISDHLDHDLDYRWKIKFKNGMVHKCKLLYMKRQDNNMRRSTAIKFKQHREMMEARLKTIRWKVYSACWRTPLSVLFKLYRRLSNILPNNIRLENKLRFWG
jgi:hypothetical protein